jgi:MFS family permease
MFALVRSLTGPLLSLILLISASGLFNTFVSVRLEMEGYSNESIGAVASSLYLGILAGSLWLDQWIAKVGHIRSFAAFAAIVTVIVLAQAIWIDPYYWAALRFIGGICTAGVFIVIESWLLVQASAPMRGAILSVYLAVFYAALSGGQLLINFSDPSGSSSFWITAILSAASILPLCLKKIPEPKIEQAARLSMAQLFRLSPLGFLGGVVSGMLLAAIYGLVPVYCKEVGMSVPEIGNMMALLIFGGLCFQWPFGRWADKGDRRRVLLFSSLLTALSGTAIALTDVQSLLLLPLAFLFGGFAFTIYPLSMAHACEKLTDDQIVPATGGFVLSYGIGAISGPLLAPLAMNLIGSSGLFYFLGLIAIALLLVGLKKLPQEN